MTWKEEVYAAARSISAAAQKRVWVCVNGGIDSEIASRAFSDQGLPFSALIVRYEDGSNAAAVSRVAAWCRERGVPLEVVDLDTAAFVRTELIAYAEQFHAVRPYRYLQIKLLSLVSDRDGFAVLGGGEQLYQADRTAIHLNPENVQFELSNETALPHRWCQQNGVEHEPYFYFSTPEIVAAYMELPLVSYALAQPDPILRHPLSASMIKRISYLGEWPDVRVRYRVQRSPRLRAMAEYLQTRFGDEFKKEVLSVPTVRAQLSAAGAAHAYV